MLIAYSAQSVIMLALQVLAIAALGFCLLHALRQRPDAFTATGKFTKGGWVAILAVSLAIILVLPMLGATALIIGAVAAGVYLGDVRPKINEIQRGPRW